MAEELVQEEDFSEGFGRSTQDSSSDMSLESNIHEQLLTHKRLRSTIGGVLVSLEKNEAVVNLVTTYDMTVDELGLVYNGCIQDSANYAAVCAINEENVVIIGAKTNFLAPAKVGDTIVFKAVARFEDSRKREISVSGKINEIKIFDGTFHAVVLEKHIFKTKIKNANREY